jgi:hypothetical protein
MPYARKTDPGTSHAAARSVQNISPTKLAIITLLNVPMTDNELVEAYETMVRTGRAPLASPSGVRSRRAELTKDGLVVDSGYTEKLASGRLAIVWASTDNGLDRIEQLW